MRKYGVKVMCRFVDSWQLQNRKGWQVCLARMENGQTWKRDDIGNVLFLAREMNE